MRIWPSQSTRHEAEGRIDVVVDDRQVEAVALGDRAPSSARRRRRADRRRGGCRAPRIASRSMHVAEVADVGVEVVVPVRRRRRAAPARSGMRLHALQAGLEQLVGALPRSSRVTSVSAGPPLGGLYLKPPSSGGLCDGVMTMPSARPLRAAAVVGEDRVRDRRRRRVLVVLGDHHLDAVGRQHLERAGEGRLRQRVRVDAEEQRAVDVLRRAVLADRLGDGEDVPFVEARGRTTSRDGRRCRTPRAAPAPRDRARSV